MSTESKESSLTTSVPKPLHTIHLIWVCIGLACLVLLSSVFGGFREFLRIMTAWSVVTFSLILVFRKEIVTLMSRIEKLIVSKTGAEIHWSQPAPAEVEKNLIPSDMASSEIGPETNEQPRKDVFWFFNYLSEFLTPSSKQAVKWFAKWKSGTKNHFDEAWSQAVPNLAERDTMLATLIFYGLLEEKDGTVEITPQGEAFATFMKAKASGFLDTPTCIKVK